jgi:tetratricopeptide (TPR) repeat protein
MDIIDRVSPDAIICQHWLAADYLSKVDIPVIIDLAVPLILEGVFKGWNADEVGIKKIKSLQKGDFFICANERQRSYYLPWLMMAGVDLQKEHIAIIPISLPPKPLLRKRGDEIVFIYSGIFWPWQDSERALMSVLKEIGRLKEGYLKIIGGKFPLDYESRVNYRTPLKNVDDSRLIRQDVIPFNKLIDEYCNASCAVDVMKRNIEREHASPIRTMTYLWCGLPVIIGDYMPISPHINEYGAGWTVSHEDKKGIARIVETIIKNSSILDERSRGAVRLIKEKFNCEETIEHLDRFLKLPFKRNRRNNGIVSISMSYGFMDRGIDLRSKGKYKEAISELKRGIEICPSMENIHLELAIAYREIGDIESALDEIEKEARVYHGKAAVHHQRGIAYRMQHKYKNALKEFNKAITIDPKAEWVHQEMGITYREMGDIENAIKEFKIEEGLYPGKTVTQYNLYSSAKDGGKREFAKRGFLDIPKKKNSSIGLKAGCCFHLGKIYLEDNRIHEAVKFFTRCLELMPEHKKAGEYLNQLKMGTRAPEHQSTRSPKHQRISLFILVTGALVHWCTIYL